MAQQLVEVDSRRRVALGKLGDPTHSRYLVTEEPDGTLIFEPAVVMTQHDAALLRHPEVLEVIDRDTSDRSRLTSRSVHEDRGFVDASGDAD